MDGMKYVEFAIVKDENGKPYIEYDKETWAVDNNDLKDRCILFLVDKLRQAGVKGNTVSVGKN